MTSARFFIPIIYQSSLQTSTIDKDGCDERYPIEMNSDQKYRISLFFHYLEEIKRLEKCNIANIEQSTILHDFFQDIRPKKMKAGGLMDDWERTIDN
jgi:hypothetical protein